MILLALALQVAQPNLACQEAQMLAVPGTCREAYLRYLGSEAEPNLVTLEDICLGGALGFTDEIHPPILCPTEPDAQPPPNWEMTLPGARQFGKDVCSERDETNDLDDPREVAACYRAYLSQRAEEARQTSQPENMP